MQQYRSRPERKRNTPCPLHFDHKVAPSRAQMSFYEEWSSTWSMVSRYSRSLADTQFCPRGRDQSMQPKPRTHLSATDSCTVRASQEGSLFGIANIHKFDFAPIGRGATLTLESAGSRKANRRSSSSSETCLANV